MRDFELLKDAANAAGLKHVDYSGLDYDGGLGLQLVDAIGRHTASWNPLSDDGDAFRLAVRLKLKVYQAENAAIAHLRMDHAYKSAAYEESGGHYSATRRAIVMAAAALKPNAEAHRKPGHE